MKTITSILLFMAISSSPAFSGQNKQATRDTVTESSSSGSNVCYSIPGMHCSGCVEKVSEEIEGVSGVKSVTVDLESKLASIVVKKGFNGFTDLTNAIKDAGYDSNKTRCEPAKKS
ncbi:MAG: heavy-metal-associated domain-containing protein [Bdellovibrionales bacterium]|nr:heavy-metal-associated domain-containing protein [Bdellovibrionales bacterium]